MISSGRGIMRNVIILILLSTFENLLFLDRVLFVIRFEDYVCIVSIKRFFLFFL